MEKKESYSVKDIRAKMAATDRQQQQQQQRQTLPSPYNTTPGDKDKTTQSSSRTPVRNLAPLPTTTVSTVQELAQTARAPPVPPPPATKNATSTAASHTQEAKGAHFRIPAHLGSNLSNKVTGQTAGHNNSHNNASSVTQQQQQQQQQQQRSHNNAVSSFDADMTAGTISFDTAVREGTKATTVPRTLIPKDLFQYERRIGDSKKKQKNYSPTAINGDLLEADFDLDSGAFNVQKFPAPMSPSSQQRHESAQAAADILHLKDDNNSGSSEDKIDYELLARYMNTMMFAGGGNGDLSESGNNNNSAGGNGNVVMRTDAFGVPQPAVHAPSKATRVINREEVLYVAKTLDKMWLLFGITPPRQPQQSETTTMPSSSSPAGFKQACGECYDYASYMSAVLYHALAGVNEAARMSHAENRYFSAMLLQCRNLIGTVIDGMQHTVLNRLHNVNQSMLKQNERLADRVNQLEEELDTALTDFHKHRQKTAEREKAEAAAALRKKHAMEVYTGGDKTKLLALSTMFGGASSPNSAADVLSSAKMDGNRAGQQQRHQQQQQQQLASAVDETNKFSEFMQRLSSIEPVSYVITAERVEKQKAVRALKSQQSRKKETEDKSVDCIDLFFEMHERSEAASRRKLRAAKPPFPSRSFLSESSSSPVTVSLQQELQNETTAVYDAKRTQSIASGDNNFAPDRDDEASAKQTPTTAPLDATTRTSVSDPVQDSASTSVLPTASQLVSSPLQPHPPTTGGQQKEDGFEATQTLESPTTATVTDTNNNNTRRQTTTTVPEQSVATQPQQQQQQQQQQNGAEPIVCKASDLNSTKNSLGSTQASPLASASPLTTATTTTSGQPQQQTHHHGHRRRRGAVPTSIAECQTDQDYLGVDVIYVRYAHQLDIDYDDPIATKLAHDKVEREEKERQEKQQQQEEEEQQVEKDSAEARGTPSSSQRAATTSPGLSHRQQQQQQQQPKVPLVNRAVQCACTGTRTLGLVTDTMGYESFVELSNEEHKRAQIARHAAKAAAKQNQRESDGAAESSLKRGNRVVSPASLGGTMTSTGTGPSPSTSPTLLSTTGGGQQDPEAGDSSTILSYDQNEPGNHAYEIATGERDVIVCDGIVEEVAAVDEFPTSNEDDLDVAHSQHRKDVVERVRKGHKRRLVLPSQGQILITEDCGVNTVQTFADDLGTLYLMQEDGDPSAVITKPMDPTTAIINSQTQLQQQRQSISIIGGDEPTTGGASVAVPTTRIVVDPVPQDIADLLQLGTEDALSTNVAAAMSPPQLHRTIMDVFRFVDMSAAVTTIPLGVVSFEYLVKKYRKRRFAQQYGMNFLASLRWCAPVSPRARVYTYFTGLEDFVGHSLTLVTKKTADKKELRELLSSQETHPQQQQSSSTALVEFEMQPTSSSMLALQSSFVRDSKRKIAFRFYAVCFRIIHDACSLKEIQRFETGDLKLDVINIGRVFTEIVRYCWSVNNPESIFAVDTENGLSVKQQRQLLLRQKQMKAAETQQKASAAAAAAAKTDAATGKPPPATSTIGDRTTPPETELEALQQLAHQAEERSRSGASSASKDTLQGSRVPSQNNFAAAASTTTTAAAAAGRQQPLDSVTEAYLVVQQQQQNLQLLHHEEDDNFARWDHIILQLADIMHTVLHPLMKDTLVDATATYVNACWAALDRVEGGNRLHDLVRDEALELLRLQRECGGGVNADALLEALVAQHDEVLLPFLLVTADGVVPWL